MKVASRDLQMLFRVGTVGGLPDGQLLERFAAHRDEASFEALVRRHGPMVWGVCRRVLRDHHDAEEAFQATFLVLARKAASVAQPELVANWLYVVASKTAARAGAMASRRRARERQVEALPEPESGAGERWDDLLPLLDREVGRLPEKYRIPVVLCDLEGKTHREAAERLGWPVGTVSGRLSRARAMLARRLVRRGVSLSVGTLGLLLSRESASAGMPASLVTPTVEGVCLLAAGQAATAGLVSARVVPLAEGVTKMMRLSKFKLVVATAILGVAGVGAAGWSLAAAGAGAGQTPRGAGSADDKAPPSPKERGKVMRELERLRGTWVAVHAEEKGVRAPDDEVRREELILTITGDEFSLKRAAGKEPLLRGTLKVAPGRQPPAMDWSATRPTDGRVMKAEGVYELKENTLKFCYGRERPEEFRTDRGNVPGYSRRLYVFEKR